MTNDRRIQLNRELADKQRFTYEYVKQYFENQGCKLLSTEFNNCHQVLDYICNCGNQAKINFSNFKRGSRCRQCGTNKAVRKLQLSYETIKQYFSDQDCVLLSTEYVNNYTPLEYTCSCGNLGKTRYSDFRNGQRCKVCKITKLTYSYEEVKQYFEDQGCRLLSTKYRNAHQKLDYICLCGDQSITTFHRFKNGSNRCKQCGVIKRSGDKNPMYGKKGPEHPHWNPNLTDEDRKQNRDRKLFPGYVDWHKLVLKRDRYSCVCCKDKGYLEAHHYFNYSQHPELRTNHDNGITLCEDCHAEYHYQYGKKDNSKPEFFLFLWTQKLGIIPDSKSPIDPEIQQTINEIINNPLDLTLEEAG